MSRPAVGALQLHEKLTVGVMVPDRVGRMHRQRRLAYSAFAVETGDRWGSAIAGS